MATIFAVDDDESVIQIYRDMVELRDHRIIAEAHNGEEAVAAFKCMNKCPDIIIMDHRMPKKNGMEAMKEIHAINPLQGIIFVTADYEAAKKAIISGANSFVLKPFRLDDLFNSIELTLNSLQKKKIILREKLLKIITALNLDDMNSIIEVCDRIDKEIIGEILPASESSIIPTDTVATRLCEFFNTIDHDYSHELEENTLVIRNAHCHWKETVGQNPQFCFITKCIISRFMKRTGRVFGLETKSAIMNNDDQCVFEINVTN